MQRTFRKYHRAIALIISLPILLTVLTGILATFVREWGLSLGVSSGWLLKIHTGEIFNLEGIYPILDGVGLLGLVVTGLSMSGIFKRKKQKPAR
ncbi:MULTISPECIES: peptidase [unclassified Leptolyngbya]|uniref:peptidase n=1 Tax=unclassified Leptolyngbya TaxID=2650499 RepID=UPI001686BE87|nr:MULTISPECIES: peptidase [unclassified Leptolyngbya]MBD1911311.1 peptidase [Leptolyngbya sp. FACHB-8]MBD2156671.1 peptidase [Leptolyngbya sp. FACHB-16]